MGIDNDGNLIIDIDGGSLRKKSNDIQHFIDQYTKPQYNIADIQCLIIKSNIMLSIAVVFLCMENDVPIKIIDKNNNEYLVSLRTRSGLRSDFEPN